MLSVALDDQRRLRLPEESDADELYALTAANREHLAQWLPWAANSTHADTLAFIRRSRKALADNTGIQLAIVDGEQIVGVIGCHLLDWENRTTSIGYWLAEAAQGKGTVTLAVRALLDHAFTSWQLHRVEIRAAPENVRSRAVPERLGFRQEGLLRQAERIGDRYVDHVVYGMLGREWAGSTTAT